MGQVAKEFEWLPDAVSANSSRTQVMAEATVTPSNPKVGETVTFLMAVDDLDATPGRQSGPTP